MFPDVMIASHGEMISFSTFVHIAETEYEVVVPVRDDLKEVGQQALMSLVRSRQVRCVH
jgi:hypothetical protein